MKKYRVLSLILLVAMIQGCAYNEMTYFRKHGATLEDERRDWGLCGGNFLADQQVSPIINREALTCMSKKGYLTINDYYEEQFISFQRLTRDNSPPTVSQMEACGYRMYKASNTCKGHWFVLTSDLPKVTQCMSRYGYEPTIPRFGKTVRLVEDPTKLHPVFCTFLSPKNRRGDPSLSGNRLE